MKSYQGHLLVASPLLTDPNFYRSVVFLIQHDDDGAFGLALDRPTRITVGQLWQEIAGAELDCSQPVNLGGPVGGPVLALHTDVTCSEDEIIPGVFLASQKEHLSRLLAQSERSYRLFSGYSGWGGGQLEQELEVGSWLTLPATVEEIFYDGDDLWKRTTRKIGDSILAPTIGSHPLPDDPSLN